MESTNKLIMAFVTLIIGVILLNVAAGQSALVTESTSGTTYVAGPDIVRWGPDNNVNTTNATALAALSTTTAVDRNPAVGCGGWDINKMYIYNGSGTYMGASGTNWTATCTDSDVWIDFENTIDMVDLQIGNDTRLYYAYYPYSYLEAGWNRSILNMTPGFFALAVLAVSLALFYSIAKDYGIA